MATVEQMAKSDLVKWTSIAAIVISIMLLMRLLPLGELQSVLGDWLGQLGVWGPVIFTLIYVVATVCFVPGFMLTLAGGAIFGLSIGFAAVSVGSVVGAAIAFLIARYGARSKITSLARSNPKFDAVDQAIAQGGWKVVGLLRLSPAIPFNLQNYLYGLTKIKFWPYVLTSWIAMIPGTLMYVYLGHAAGVAATASGERSTAQWVLLAVGLLATIVVTVYVTRLARQKLRQQTDIPAESTEQPSEPNGNGTSRPLALPVIAACLLGLAVAAQFQSEAIAAELKSWLGLGPPRVTMQETFQQNPNGPTVDHSLWNRILQAHVQPGGWVDYQAIAADSSKLDQYIDSLAAVPLEHLGRNERLALLINAYNACTVKLICEHYPLGSIKDIPSRRRWQDQRWKIGPHSWSLDEIEHQQIRPHFVEPRIHFAVVCAAVGCPPLARKAYEGEKLDDQLQAQADYVHTHDTWFQLADSGDRVGLTKLYDWYGGDFRQVADSVLDYAAQYTPPLRRRLEHNESVDHYFLPYDWSLNGLENQQPR